MVEKIWGHFREEVGLCALDVLAKSHQAAGFGIYCTVPIRIINFFQ